MFGPQRTTQLIDLLRRLERTTKQSHLDEIRTAIEQIDGKAGLLEVERLSANMQIGYDRLNRRFKSMLGISPKQYASIMCFYGFAGSLLGDARDSLAQLAALKGYYDQAHAAREFKRYTGISERRFQQTLNGIAKLMQVGAYPPDSYKN